MNVIRIPFQTAPNAQNHYVYVDLLQRCMVRGHFEAIPFPMRRYMVTEGMLDLKDLESPNVRPPLAC